MRLAGFLALAVVLAQAGAAVALLVVGSWVAGGLLAVGAAATVACLIQISHSLGQTSHRSEPFTATDRHFY